MAHKNKPKKLITNKNRHLIFLFINTTILHSRKVHPFRLKKKKDKKKKKKGAVNTTTQPWQDKLDRNSVTTVAHFLLISTIFKATLLK